MRFRGHEFGCRGVLEVGEADMPRPGSDELLARVIELGLFWDC